MESTMLRYIIGTARVKYAVLDDQFRATRISQPKVNIYVDGYSILYRLYYRKYSTQAILGNMSIKAATKDLVVGFINALAHYRRYVYTRLKKTNDVFVFFNMTTPPKYQRSFFPDYRKTRYDQFSLKHYEFSVLNEIVTNALPFIQNVLSYVEGMYTFFNTGLEEATGMKCIMGDTKLSSDCYHLILSNDVIPMQLIDYNCSQLMMHKDKSKLLTPINAFFEFTKTSTRVIPDSRLTPAMLPYMWCIGGCDDVDLPKTGIAGGKIAMVSAMNKLIEKGLLSSTTSFNTFITNVETTFKKKFNPNIRWESRYRAVNIGPSVAAITASQREHLASNIFDLYDQNGLEELNETLADLGNDTELLEITNLNMSTYEDYYNNRR